MPIAGNILNNLATSTAKGLIEDSLSIFQNTLGYLLIIILVTWILALLFRLIRTLNVF